MLKRRIIDATHLLSDGGLTILEIYLNNIQISSDDFILLSFQEEIDGIQNVFIPNEWSRMFGIVKSF